MEEIRKIQPTWRNFLPAILALLGSFAMLGLKISRGENFISDGALMMLALACYLMAAIFQLTNLYAPSEMARKSGLFLASLGVFFNLSSWLVRWVAGYEHEIAILRDGGNPITPWIFRYIPFANLYDLSLAFAFGAGITTLLLANRKKFQFLAAFSLPLAALILTLARFIGSEFIELPPVLDSYWRPIHVGVASLSYGVALVCFAVAVIYLLKDRVKPEAMAIWSSIFALGVIATVSKFSVFSEFVYRTGIFLPPSVTGRKPIPTPFRLDLPYVGETLAIAGILLLGVIIAFAIYVYQNNETAKKAGHWMLRGAFLAQVLAIVFFANGVNSIKDVQPRLQAQLQKSPQQLFIAGKEIARQQSDMTVEERAQLTPKQLTDAAGQYFAQTGGQMYLSLGTNPVEFAGLITAFAATFFVLLFSFKTEKLRESLPSLETLDGLMYKTACLAFAGIAMLL
ncbi:MAG: cytochrome c biogenesis protein CcsA, partial [Pyrinomonadaceae bacterium]